MKKIFVALLVLVSVGCINIFGKEFLYRDYYAGMTIKDLERIHPKLTKSETSTISSNELLGKNMDSWFNSNVHLTHLNLYFKECLNIDIYKLFSNMQTYYTTDNYKDFNNQPIIFHIIDDKLVGLETFLSLQEFTSNFSNSEYYINNDFLSRVDIYRRGRLIIVSDTLTTGDALGEPERIVMLFDENYITRLNFD